MGTSPPTGPCHPSHPSPPSPFARRVGPADRPSAVPAEALGLRHHRIGHQRFQRIGVGHPRNLHQPTAELPDRREHPRGRRHAVLRLGIRAGNGDVRKVVVVVEIGSEDRLGGLQAHSRRARRWVGPLGGGADICGVVGVGFEVFGHQSKYLGIGGAGAGPSTVNHLRYNVFHVPSRRMRSSVPLTNLTSPGLLRLTPTP